jgi:hypothetical protein
LRTTWFTGHQSWKACYYHLAPWNITMYFRSAPGTHITELRNSSFFVVFYFYTNLLINVSEWNFKILIVTFDSNGRRYRRKKHPRRPQASALAQRYLARSRRYFTTPLPVLSVFPYFDHSKLFFSTS